MPPPGSQPPPDADDSDSSRPPQKRIRRQGSFRLTFDYSKATAAGEGSECGCLDFCNCSTSGSPAKSSQSVSAHEQEHSMYQDTRQMDSGSKGREGGGVILTPPGQQVSKENSEPKGGQDSSYGFKGARRGRSGRADSQSTAQDPTLG